jgi:hypothetical protein
MELVPWGELAGSSHAPAPLAPSLRVHDGPAGHHAAATSLGRRVERRGWRTAWQGFKKSATASFAFVETCGLAWGLDLVRRSLGVTSWAVDPRFDGVAAADREAFGPLIDDRPLTGAYGDRLIELAAGIVRGLHLPDLDTPLVVLCGHASRTVNNPLKAALDCGACCGQAGGRWCWISTGPIRPQCRRPSSASTCVAWWCRPPVPSACPTSTPGWRRAWPASPPERPRRTWPAAPASPRPVTAPWPAA